MGLQERNFERGSCNNLWTFERLFCDLQHFFDSRNSFKDPWMMQKHKFMFFHRRLFFRPKFVYSFFVICGHIMLCELQIPKYVISRIFKRYERINSFALLLFYLNVVLLKPGLEPIFSLSFLYHVPSILHYFTTKDVRDLPATEIFFGTVSLCICENWSFLCLFGFFSGVLFYSLLSSYPWFVRTGIVYFLIDYPQLYVY